MPREDLSASLYVKDDRALGCEILALISAALRPPTDPAALSGTLQRLRQITAGEVRDEIETAVGRAAGMSMEREYHRLFYGPMKPPAAPFESVYRHGSLEGPAAAEMRARFRRADVELPVGLRIPPDHVSVEIEFLALLESRVVGAALVGDLEGSRRLAREARRFAEGHLARWLPSLLARLEAAAPESPYTGLVRAAVLAAGIAPSKGPD